MPLTRGDLNTKRYKAINVHLEFIDNTAALRPSTVKHSS